MHDLVHDLAKEILAHQINARSNKCRYALLTDCSKPLQLSFPANIKALHFRDCDNILLCGGEFSPVKYLRVLDLSECFISELPNYVGQLKQLRFLRAPRIGRQIPDFITKLSELNYLNLTGSSSITTLPESIGDMKALMHLDLSGCDKIRELPVSFAELKQLVHLDLSHCTMAITGAIGGFTKLQYLNLLVENTIDGDRRELSEVIGNLTKLKYLNLSGCMKIIIPSIFPARYLLDPISTLFNLEHLDLSNNEDRFIIPESMGNLRNLHTLNLSYCINLRDLPDSVVKMVSLKVLNVENCWRLDKSVLPPLKVATLPDFVVHASSDNCSSNIILLQPTNPEELNIARLENVKSAEEAQSIKLIQKQNISKLSFRWTVYSEISNAGMLFLDDKEVLGKLVPPSSVHDLWICGYRSVSIPNWFMDIRHYLPNILKIKLSNFPKCNNLPQLGKLPNLQELSLWCMDSLEEWNTTYSSGKEGENEPMFLKLQMLSIRNCAKLMIKPFLPKCKTLDISVCDTILSSWGESSSDSGACSSSPITKLTIKYSKVPMHQWRLLHHLPALRSLTISSCSDLTSSPEIIQHLSSVESLHFEGPFFNQEELPRWFVELGVWWGSMTSLPDWIGELASLKKLNIENCEGISSLPDSIQQLKLEDLRICGCPILEKWCASEESKMKLAHIREKDIGRSLLAQDEYTRNIFSKKLHFVVEVSSDKCSSNINLLQPTYPDKLEIDNLENVKSREEAESIELVEKRNITELTFRWTRAADRFVDDKEVLEKLVPPSSVQKMWITGYKSVSVPDWHMGIRQYLPNLVYINLSDFPKCNKLPSLGQLPNLRYLYLCRMESLEEWNMLYTGGVDGATELMFPKLLILSIEQCAKLRIKPCLPRAIMYLTVIDCDNMLSSWGEMSSDSGASSSSQITCLTVKCTKLPMHQWRLLHHLPALCRLSINSCSDLTTSPEIIQHLYSLEVLHLEELSLNQADMASLLHWLGELTSLQNLKIHHCEGNIYTGRSLSDLIQQLTKLQFLEIYGFPPLTKKCCISDVENFVFNSDEEDESNNEEDIANESDEEEIVETVEETTNTLVDTASGSRNIEETIDLANARGAVDNSVSVIHGTVTDEVRQRFRMCCCIVL